MTGPAIAKDSRAHDEVLSLLARAQGDGLKALAEQVIPRLGHIEVILNRTGLVMLPMRDTAQGTHFHLGEVLMSEAQIEAVSQQGYGMRRGRDLEAAMAMAVVDLAIACGVAPEPCAAFLDAEAARQTSADEDALRRIEATRVNMETF